MSNQEWIEFLTKGIPEDKETQRELQELLENVVQ